MGDVLLLTPALQALRAQLPEAHISVLVGPWAASLLAGSPLVDHLHTCAFPGFTRQERMGLLQPYWLLLTTAARITLAGYDVALIARDDHWWGALLTALARIPRRIGFAVPEVAPFLTMQLPYALGAHVAAQNLELVAALTGVEPAPYPMQLTITPAARVWAEERLGSVQGRLVAIHPGAGGQAKLWLAERWIAVAHALEEAGSCVVLTGGPGEAALVATIGAALRRPIIVTDAPSLVHLGALFRCCQMVLGVDSGPLHVAVAVGVPTLALFGPGNVGRFGPWGDPGRQVVIRSGLWCSPCGVLEHCPRGTAPSECMALIPSDAVIQRATALLEVTQSPV